MYSHSDDKFLSKAFGLRVQRAREAAGLTKAQLARDAEVDSRSLARLESGKGRVRLVTALRVARTLGLDLERAEDA
ncbi:MAG TPA: helix-turn-helix transcriptional regulator [Solirubrobacterales bacterium]|jgi:transcriptional regulator with XRE-family HTH domain|nr:helix-turn-helix transcriptional regulator [Solirubrobacterales bacterium]